MRKLAIALTSLLAMLLATQACVAQKYPSKRITLVVGYPAGGPTDLFARITAEGISKQLGQSVIVDNRGGASGSTGTDFVAKSAPDGYTLVFGTNGTHAVNYLTYPQLPYHPIKDFQPIALVAVTPNVLIVRKDLPVKSLSDLIKLAKEKPGQLLMASAGAGASNHLAGVLLQSLAKVEMRHIPYRGSGPAAIDLLGGRIDWMFDSLSTALPNIQAGAVRAIAVSTQERTPILPDVPTVEEEGVPGYEAPVWWGVWAPAGTPPDVVETLNAAIRRAQNTSETQRRFAELGATAGKGSAADLGVLQQRELDKWTKIVKDTNLKF